MKFARILLLVSLFSLTGEVAYSQVSVPLRPSVVSATTKDTSTRNNSSWLFILENRTQWVLLLQDNMEKEEDGSRSAHSVSQLGGSDDTMTDVNGGVKSASAKLRMDDKKFDDKTYTFVFQGNTRSIPLEPDPSKKPPSAPSS